MKNYEDAYHKYVFGVGVSPKHPTEEGFKEFVMQKKKEKQIVRNYLRKSFIGRKIHHWIAKADSHLWSFIWGR